MFKIMIVEDDYKISEIMIENIKKWNFDVTGVEDFNEVYGGQKQRAAAAIGGKNNDII